MTDFTETFNKTGTANEDKLIGKKAIPLDQIIASLKDL
jgi:hypothetical protein